MTWVFSSGAEDLLHFLDVGELRFGNK